MSNSWLLYSRNGVKALGGLGGRSTSRRTRCREDGQVGENDFAAVGGTIKYVECMSSRCVIGDG